MDNPHGLKQKHLLFRFSKPKRLDKYMIIIAFQNHSHIKLILILKIYLKLLLVF
jgi:hypothetical protein